MRAIAKDNGIPFVVDETKTGVGITGKMWGHDNWYLHDPVDIVTFGGRAGISGFYYAPGFRQNELGISYD